MFRLLRHYSIVCALALAVTVCGLAYLYWWSARGDLVSLVESQNVAMARSLSNGLGPRLDWLLTGSNVRNFGASLAMLVEGLPVLKIKVFHPRTGGVMYSTVPDEINAEAAAEPGFQRALAGRTASALAYRHEVATFSGVVFGRQVVESFVPLFDKTGKIASVLALSADVTDRIAKIQRSAFILVGLLAAVAALLYGMLYVVVRRAELLIRRQHDTLAAAEKSLEDSNRQLEHEIAERLQVEEALNEVNSMLESRVEERTAELTQEISERRRAEEGLREAQRRLLRQANFDSLTGLPNRTLFLDRLNQVLNRAKRDGETAAVLFLDLDNFKDINDTLGHAAGDELLRQAARRLTECVRGEDTVARLGGDEFTVVLQEIGSGNSAAVVANKIIQAFRTPFDINGHEMYALASIGITVYPDDGTTGDALLKNADAALYRAKSEGRNAYRFFTAEINALAMEQMRIEGYLRRALERQEFWLCFQPILDAASGRPIAVEALLRWENSDLGVVPPSRFVPIAEDKGLIGAIGEWVMDSACRTVKSWQDQGAEGLRLCVNVSSRQFREGRILTTVGKALDLSGLAPECLELELTENLLMEDGARVRDMLAELSANGVRLCIDDFGTGYSPLNYLKRFLFTSVKIDRLFLSEVTHNAADARITQAIIDLAHTLGLQVIGEGVETDEQIAFLRTVHCDLVQGNLFCPPLRADEAAAFIFARLPLTADVAAGD